MNAKMFVEELRGRYRDRALAPDVMFLLKPHDALEFLAEAQAAGVPLAGVDGFLVTESGAYQPNQDFSNDVSDFHVTQDEFYLETRELIMRGEPDGICFEVVFDLVNS